MAAEKEKDGAGGERWKAAIVNLSDMSENLDSLQKILAKKAVFVDDDTFSKASLIAEQARNIKALEQRVGTLERELDAAIAAAARARSEKRQAEAAQRAAELHAQDVTRELENTTRNQIYILLKGDEFRNIFTMEVILILLRILPDLI